MANRGPIWFGIALVAVVAAIGVWIYFLQPAQGLNVNVQLTSAPGNVFLGDPFDVSVALSNNSNSAMQTSSVSLILPNGIISVDSPNQRVVTQMIGTVDASGVSHRDFHLVATGPANTVFHIGAKVTYAVSGSSAQFENDGSINVPAGQPAVTAALVVPNTSVFSGQNFPTIVNYTNNTDHAIQNFSIAMQYPPAYTFLSASTSLLVTSTTMWNLGSVPPQGTGSITVNGNLVGPGDTSYPFAASVAASIGGQNYPVATPVASLSLAASPLTFTVSVNNSKTYVSKPNDPLNYVLSFTNNSPVTFQNVIISAKVTGTMFNLSSIQTNGSFNSINNTITWNGAASPQLLSLAPGQTGQVNFYINTKSAFPIRLLSDKNYSVSVSARLQSPTVPPGTVASSTISVASLSTKLGGQIVLAAKVYHKEPTAGVGGSLGASGITNSGPYPPRVNQASQYTIHWLLTNYATDADNVIISAYLQSGTECTKNAQAPASTTFTCNPANGQVTWQIPVVAATTGITGKPLEAVFQVTNTPAVNQIGQDVTLIGPVTLTATDGFTGSAMQSSAGQMTTVLPDDTNYPSNPREVTP